MTLLKRIEFMVDFYADNYPLQYNNQFLEVDTRFSGSGFHIEAKLVDGSSCCYGEVDEYLDHGPFETLDQLEDYMLENLMPA